MSLFAPVLAAEEPPDGSFTVVVTPAGEIHVGVHDRHWCWFALTHHGFNARQFAVVAQGVRALAPGGDHGGHSLAARQGTTVDIAVRLGEALVLAFLHAIVRILSSNDRLRHDLAAALGGAGPTTVWTIKEYAERRGYHPNTIENLIRRGHISTLGTGRLTRIVVEESDQRLRELREDPGVEIETDAREDARRAASKASRS